MINQTDAIPIERLVMCLLRMKRFEEAELEVDRFVMAFPHAEDLTIVARCRDRIARAIDKRTGARAAATPPS